MKRFTIRLLTVLLSVLIITCMLSGCSRDVQGSCLTHVEKWIVDEPATCTEKGIKHAECEICGRFLKVDEIEVEEHNYVDCTCADCGKSIATHGLAFAKIGDCYTLAGIGKVLDGEILIPLTYKSLPVTSIFKNAFSDNEFITSVIIQDNILDIGDSAFYQCAELVDVTIGDGAKRIGQYAFAHCGRLISVAVGNGVENIDYSAFYNCEILTNIVIGNNVKNIKASAFYGCKNLVDVKLPNSLISIGDSAFYNCTSLKSVKIPSGVENIGNSVFYRCASLTSIDIPNSVTSIGNSSFYWCDQLTSINFNGTVAEWNNITKGSSWNFDVPATKVVCTDGEVVL